MRAIPLDIVAIAGMARSYSGRRTSRPRCCLLRPARIVRTAGLALAVAGSYD